MADSIDASKYTTAAKAAEAVGGVSRQALDAGMRRGDKPLDVQTLHCGRLIVSVASVRKWAKVDRPKGPKPKS